MAVILIILCAVMCGVALYFSFEPKEEETTPQITQEVANKMTICDFEFCKYNNNFKCFKPFYPEATGYCKYTFCNSLMFDMVEKQIDK
jgi:hypothetical protein